MKKCKYISKGTEYRCRGTADGKGIKRKTTRCIMHYRVNKFTEFFYKIFKCRNCKSKGGKIHYDN
jgi:hypothetical protein